MLVFNSVSRIIAMCVWERGGWEGESLRVQSRHKCLLSSFTLLEAGSFVEHHWQLKVAGPGVLGNLLSASCRCAGVTDRTLLHLALYGLQIPVLSSNLHGRCFIHWTISVPCLFWLCVYTCSCVSLFICMCAYLCGGQRSVLCIVFSCISTLFFETRTHRT